MKKLLKFFILIIMLVGIYFVLPYHVQMGLKHTFADVDDYKIFPNHIVEESPAPKPWLVSETYNKSTPSAELLHFFDERETCAFLVIKNGKIV
ncbi:MAG TPA: hypothetical protein PLK15_06165, partial [Chitinophagales bacterium]|nr:hypothetical protein [Chitinophagales bacterium]